LLLKFPAKFLKKMFRISFTYLASILKKKKD